MNPHTNKPIRTQHQIFSNLNARREHRLQPHNIKIKLPILMFLDEITHGFNLPTLHRYHLHTHEPLIGSECGEFLKNKETLFNLKIKLNG